MEQSVILVVQGADFESAEVQEALSSSGAEVLGVKGSNAWIYATAEAGFFTSEEKVARAAAATTAAAIPGTQAVAYESQDQGGGVRHHLVGDRWNPPEGLGAGMFAGGDELAWFAEIESRAHQVSKRRRQERKQDKDVAKLAGHDGRPLLADLDQAPASEDRAASLTQTIDGP